MADPLRQRDPGAVGRQARNPALQEMGAKLRLVIGLYGRKNARRLAIIGF